MNTFGAVVKKRMEELEISNEYIESKMNMSDMTLSYILNSESPFVISVEDLNDFNKHLKITNELDIFVTRCGKHKFLVSPIKNIDIREDNKKWF